MGLVALKMVTAAAKGSTADRSQTEWAGWGKGIQPGSFVVRTIVAITAGEVACSGEMKSIDVDVVPEVEQPEGEAADTECSTAAFVMAYGATHQGHVR